MPVGKKTWFLPGSFCNKGLDEERPLLLSSCKEGEFTCNDGQCIDIRDHCDGVTHCEDLSDEKTCELVMVDPEKLIGHSSNYFKDFFL